MTTMMATNARRVPARIHIPDREAIPGPAVLAGLGAGVAVAATTGLAALGQALGLRGRGEDPVTADDVAFDCDAERIVMSDDGIALAVREVGPRTAPITVIFVHGFTLRSASWVLVMKELRRRWGSDVRMLFPDCRGHGDSGVCTPEQCTMARLGDDLATIIRDCVPDGPIVVAGHSMGGMALCALAGRHPELIGTRVVGAAFIATASDSLTDAGLAAALRNPAIDLFRAAVRRAPSVMERGWRVLSPLAVPFVTAGAYGRGDRSATAALFSSTMVLSAPLSTYAGFLPALENYDESAALVPLRAIETVVACGDHDWMTPLRRSKALAEALDSEFVVLVDAGHMVILESAARVATALVELVARAVAR